MFKPVQRTPAESAEIKRRILLWYLNDAEEPIGTRIGKRKLAERLGVDKKYIHHVVRGYTKDPSKVLEPISEPRNSYEELAAKVLAGHPLPVSSSNLAPASPGLVDPMHRSYDRDCQCDSCIRSRRETPFLEDVNKKADGTPLYSDTDLLCAFHGLAKPRRRRDSDIYAFYK